MPLLLLPLRFSGRVVRTLFLAALNLHAVAHTGMVYDSPQHPEFPFERVGCIFNHENLWVNVQPWDIPKRSVPVATRRIVRLSA